MDLKFANKFKCFTLDVPAFVHGYPSGYPSTGFVAAMMFHQAILVGFENAPMYESTHFHNFDYEHAYIELNRKNILL